MQCGIDIHSSAKWARDYPLIRAATDADIQDIARLGAIFHAQADWDEIIYNEADCAKSLAAFMRMPEFLCFVAETDSIVGMIAGIMSPVYFNHDHLSGEELFWWASQEAPAFTGARLLAALENAAREKGCSTWQMKSLARLGGERMERLYERHGYRASERMFIKVL